MSNDGEDWKGKTQRWLRDENHSSLPEQLILGGAFGLASGCLSGMFGRPMALTGGLALLAIQVFRFANQRGYINMNEKKWKNDLDKAKKRIAESLDSGEQNPAVDFIQQNMFVAAAFAGGLILGIRVI